MSVPQPKSSTTSLRPSTSGTPGQRAGLDLAGRVLGIGHRAPAEYFQEVREKLLKARGIAEADVEASVRARWDARARKDWAEADRVRDELVGLGVVLMDGADGTTWRMRVGGEAA